MGFANPGALLLSPLLAVLIFLYLWERRRRRLDVPSLLLWQDVQEAAVRRSRFQPDPLFFLQLAILAALLLGLADPFFGAVRGDGESPQRQIIVLDVSASMQTREGDETRLAQAKHAIAARVAALDAAAEVMLITVADRPNVALPFTTEHQQLVHALDRVEALDLGTNLDGALTLASRAAASGDATARIDLFTDIPPAQLSPQWLGQVNVWPIGETDDNLAIEGLRVFQGSFQSARNARAYVTVRNHSAQESHGSLAISIDDRLIDRQLFTIAPGAAREFSAAGFPVGGLLRAHLERDDALIADDTALAWVREPRRIRVLLVSEDTSLASDLQAIATGGGFLDLTVQSPTEYSAVQATADLFLFHRFVPSTPPHAPCLFIFPETTDGFLTATGEATDAEILDFDRSHPALRGLQPRNAFPLRRAKLLALPRWADPILEMRFADRTMPLAFAGEDGGRRIAVLAFDLAAERLLATDHESLLLLFLNLVDWLTVESAPVRVVHTGDTLTARDLGETVEIIDPLHRSMAASEETGSLLASRSGAYTLRGPQGESLLLVNFADARESDIGREPASPHLANRAPGHGRTAPARGFGRLLLAAAAILLLAEWPLARREA